MFKSVLYFIAAFVANIVTASWIDDNQKAKDAMEQACGNLPTKMRDDIATKCEPVFQQYITDITKMSQAYTALQDCMKNECQNKTWLIIAIAAGSLCLVGCTVYCCMKRRQAKGTF